jgi:hypothetical protein
MMKRVMFVLGLAACGGGQKPAPAPTPAPTADPAPAPVGAADCTGAVNNTMAVSQDDLKKTPQLIPLVPKITEIMIKHCKDDAWSAATVQCMVDGKTAEAQEKCEQMLTPDQGKKVTTDLSTALQAAAQPPAQ